MITEINTNSQNPYSILRETQLLKVSDRETSSVFDGCPWGQLLVLIWSQLGDFDNLEYAWWLQKAQDKLRENNITVRAVGIGDRRAGEKFCDYTGFPKNQLFVDPQAEIHQALGLYSGLSIKFPLLSTGQNAWLNLMLMCAGIASPGTLREVLRGYTGDRKAPQLFADEEVIRGTPLPSFKGASFKLLGGKGFQRPIELATLRLQNMTEVLSNWKTYVPNSAYLTQRGGTFLFDGEGKLLYEHRDRGILGFAENMSNPLSFLFTQELV